MGPGSTVSGAALLNAVLIEASALAATRGLRVAVLRSANLDEGDRELEKSIAPYVNRIPAFAEHLSDDYSCICACNSHGERSAECRWPSPGQMSMANQPRAASSPDSRRVSVAPISMRCATAIASISSNDFLPFMDRFVIDHRYGGFMCITDYDGSRASDTKDCWFEGRGIWVYAFLYNHLAREQRFGRGTGVGSVHSESATDRR